MHRWMAVVCMVGGIAAAPNPDGIRDMPLYTAHEELALAKARILECDYARAVAPLTVVTQALNVFETQERGPDGEAAQYIRQEIQSYMQSIRAKHADALSRVDNWIARVHRLCPKCKYPPAPAGSF